MTNPKQLWVWQQYTVPQGAHNVKPSLCHPMYAKARREYMRAEYDATVVESFKRDCAIDFGGAVIKANSHLSDSVTIQGASTLRSGGDQRVEVQVGKHRVISCWAHQLEETIGALEDAVDVGFDGLLFKRFYSWPGRLLFISGADCTKVLRAFKSLFKTIEAIDIAK